MTARLLLRRVNLIEAPCSAARQADVWIDGSELSEIVPPDAQPPLVRNDRAPEGRSEATGEQQRSRDDDPVHELDAHGLWLGPALVDPHSVLEDAPLGRAETLASLQRAAAGGGYGQVALLPWALDWRDRPERLQQGWPDPMRLHLWGSFSLDGQDGNLAPHADQIAAGAIGLAGSDHIPPLDLLERGLRLAETADRPILIAPRDASLSQGGFVRERVEALRAGWPPDPALSELLPLRQLLTLNEVFPQAPLRLMNLSTREAVAALASHSQPPLASVGWWHLLADSDRLDPAAEGWRLVPSLGGAGDRQALIGALAEGLITCVAVHHQALDQEERLLPLDQRRPGLAGHGLVLSLLWQELVNGHGWTPEQLWQVLCWGPSRFLGLPPDTLRPGSRRWILVDPEARWRLDRSSSASLAANRPHLGDMLTGRVVASGISDPQAWALPGGPWH